MSDEHRERRIPTWLLALWMPVAVVVLLGLGVLLSEQSRGLYERYFNPEPLLSYDYGVSDGMVTSRNVYRRGDVVELIVTRCIRVDGKLKNEVYLSEDGQPRTGIDGQFLATIESSVPPGCTTRLAAVAKIPDDAKVDRTYTLAGAATITTRFGEQTVHWKSTRFYVVGGS